MIRRTGNKGHDVPRDRWVFEPINGQLVHSEPIPADAIAEDAVAVGWAGYKKEHLLLSELKAGERPYTSPLIHFKASQRCIWTINDDRTLYDRHLWSNVVSVEPVGPTWRVVSKDIAMFDCLRLEALPRYASRLEEHLRQLGLIHDSVTTASADPISAPAGWYSDPSGRSQQRWWDGQAWSAHVANDGVVTREVD